MIALTVVIFQVLACLGIGAAGLRVLGLASGSSAKERFVYAFALGMGLIGWLVFFFGIGGYLNSTMFIVMLGAGTAGMVFLRRSLFENWYLPEGLAVYLLGVLIVAAGFMDLLEALTPSGDADSLAYQFALPKQFLAAGRIEFVPRALDGAISLLVQMTYIPVLGLGGETALMLWVFFSGWVAVYAVYVLARRHLNENWSLAVALVFATTPAVIYGAGSGQVEVRNLIFVVAAVLAVTVRDRSQILSYSLLAGLLAGFFVGGKYMGLLFAAACGLAVLWEQRRLTPGIVYGIGVIIAGVQWYAWNAVHIGDPVFPMLFEWLGDPNTPFWSAEHQERFRQDILPSYKSVPTSLFWLVAFPFKATLDGELAFESGRTGFGPIVWMLLVFAVAALYRFRSNVIHSTLLTYILIVVVFYFTWFLSGSPQRVRFLLPIYPLLLIPVAVAAVRFAAKNSTWKPLIAAFALTIIIQIGGHALFSIKSAKYVFGNEARDGYLLRTISEFDPVPWINKNLGESDKLLLQFRHYLYYLDVPFYYAHPNLQAQVNLLQSATEFPAFVRQLRNLGITHILLPKSDDQNKSGIGKFVSNTRFRGCFLGQKEFLTKSISSRTLPNLRLSYSKMIIYRVIPENCS